MTGPVPPWRTGWTSRPAPSAGTSTGCASSGTPCVRPRDPTAATAWTPAPSSRRCCSTTSRPWPSPSRCSSPPPAAPTSGRPPYARWRPCARCCPPGCGTVSTPSRSPRSPRAVPPPSTPRSSSHSPRRSALARSCASITRRATATSYRQPRRTRRPPHPDGSSRTTSSPATAAGTCWPGTWTARTGGPSASTASARACRPGPASPRARSPAATRVPSSAACSRVPEVGPTPGPAPARSSWRCPRPRWPRSPTTASSRPWDPGAADSPWGPGPGRASSPRSPGTTPTCWPPTLRRSPAPSAPRPRRFAVLPQVDP